MRSSTYGMVAAQRGAPQHGTKGQLVHKLVIVADDLSGAADCGIACVNHGLSTLVTFGDTAPAIVTDAIAIDADTRSLPASEAAQRTAFIVRQAIREDGQILYKKLDSTLRGHAAAELAATLSTRQAATSQRTVLILAPAFPANGRTTIRGHQMLHGKHLHETELGLREQMTEKCDLAAMMRATGLCPAVIPLNLIRSSQQQFQSALHQLAIVNDVLICDAETDEDLCSIANSGMTLASSVIWAGSAGLMHHLPQAAGLSRCPQSTQPLLSTGPTLFIVGSTSITTRNQLQHLRASAPIAAITIAPQTLLDGPSSLDWEQAQVNIITALAAKQDTAIILGNETLLSKHAAPQLAQAMGQLLASHHNAVGSLVATGGETARAVLQAWGISALRLVRELEPGLPLSITEGGHRPLPVITKAGAFGRPMTLLNCLQTLCDLKPIQ